MKLESQDLTKWELGIKSTQVDIVFTWTASTGFKEMDICLMEVMDSRLSHGLN